MSAIPLITPAAGDICLPGPRDRLGILLRQAQGVPSIRRGVGLSVRNRDHGLRGVDQGWGGDHSPKVETLDAEKTTWSCFLGFSLGRL